ncbi:hypothetical protein Taro_000732 [Colocasia esculenta]|uniref:Uncharacterized protein n=1 Tax=Colocasia esculenta TaxID=4460 RepID=A0A843TG39_COLES|nr:hypothetical protein [Colocasia esculenta]
MFTPNETATMAAGVEMEVVAGAIQPVTPIAPSSSFRSSSTILLAAKSRGNQEQKQETRFSNKLGPRVASLERWGSGERLGKIIVFLNLALHQPRNLQRVLSVQRALVSTLLDLVSTHCPKTAQKEVMKNQWSPMGQGKSDEQPSI